MALAKCNYDLQSTKQQLLQANSSMRSLARTSWFGRGSAAIEEAEQLSNNTVAAGRLYFNRILPSTVDLVMWTKDMFEDIKTTDVEDSVDLQDILEMICQAQSNWQSTLQQHESILTNMKTTTNKAQKISMQLEYQRAKNESEAARLREKANTKDNWGAALAILLPVVGLLPAAALWSSAEDNRSEANHQTDLTVRHAITSQNVAQDLIPAAKSFIEQADIITGFLNDFRAQIELVQSDAKEQIGQFKRYKVIMIKRKATEIVKICENIQLALPSEFIELLCF